MRGVEALKIYNAERGMWCIPKKGTPEHAEVRKIMGVPEKKAKAPKAPKDAKVAELRREARELMKDAKAETSEEKRAAILRGLKEVKAELKEYIAGKAVPKIEAAAPPARRVVKMKKGAAAEKGAQIEPPPKRVVKMEEPKPEPKAPRMSKAILRRMVDELTSDEE